MENKGSQNSVQPKDSEKELVEQAVTQINNIQFTGQALRAQIDAVKTGALDAIEAEDRQRRFDDAIEAKKRFEIIKKMREAAASGDFAKMQMLKQLLDENKSSL